LLCGIASHPRPHVSRLLPAPWSERNEPTTQPLGSLSSMIQIFRPFLPNLTSALPSEINGRSSGDRWVQRCWRLMCVDRVTRTRLDGLRMWRAARSPCRHRQLHCNLPSRTSFLLPSPKHCNVLSVGLLLFSILLHALSILDYMVVVAVWTEEVPCKYALT
jgi:hypothetical protein